MKDKKGELGMETIFFILMGVFFIGILLFGFSKIFLLQDELSEQDRVELSLKIQDAFERCEDPLAKGSLQSVPITYDQVQTICVIAQEEDISTLGITTTQEIATLYETGDNVFMLGEEDIILDSFSLQPQDSFCSSREDGEFVLQIQC